MLGFFLLNPQSIRVNIDSPPSLMPHNLPISKLSTHSSLKISPESSCVSPASQTPVNEAVIPSAMDLTASQPPFLPSYSPLWRQRHFLHQWDHITSHSEPICGFTAHSVESQVLPTAYSVHDLPRPDLTLLPSCPLTPMLFLQPHWPFSFTSGHWHLLLPQKVRGQGCSPHSFSLCIREASMTSLNPPLTFFTCLFVSLLPLEWKLHGSGPCPLCWRLSP